ncbi:MAG TPA: DUF2199 domain-containing protein [Candidatus Binatia bacterium]|nr:DUF2199 domain-containing protein [Candidatus Binatia bacterium]
MRAWQCSRCGKEHTETPQSFAFDAPWPWHITPKSKRQPHCALTSEYCILFNEDFFVRGCLEIPIVDNNEPFIWGIWVSLSREHFEQHRSHPDPVDDEEPYFGWLCSRIQMYPDTLLLKTHVHRRQGRRPFIELEPSDHPLAIEQRTGITRERAREIAELYEHKWVHPRWDEKGLYGSAS